MSSEDRSTGSNVIRHNESEERMMAFDSRLERRIEHREWTGKETNGFLTQQTRSAS